MCNVKKSNSGQPGCRVQDRARLQNLVEGQTAEYGPGPDSKVYTRPIQLAFHLSYISK